MTYWTAFYTKPRNEKKASERLLKKGFEVYCPTRTGVKQWSDRNKKVKEVLFTSYIFARVNEFERQQVLEDQGIVSSVFWLKRPVRIPDEEINKIKDFLSDHPGAALLNQALTVGDVVKIKTGPLKGEDGVLKRIKIDKIIITITSLGLSLQAELPASQLA